MIRGAVNAKHEGIVRLRIRGPGGVEADVDAIVDTGYTASMALPMSVVTTLGLVRQSASSAVLADGSVRQFDVYAAEVEWGGLWRVVLASTIGNESLVGLHLLAGQKLVMEVVPGGLVEIKLLH